MGESELHMVNIVTECTCTCICVHGCSNKLAITAHVGAYMYAG